MPNKLCYHFKAVIVTLISKKMCLLELFLKKMLILQYVFAIN